MVGAVEGVVVVCAKDTRMVQVDDLFCQTCVPELVDEAMNPVLVEGWGTLASSQALHPRTEQVLDNLVDD